MPTDFLKKVVVALMQTGAINFWITTLEDSENYVNYIVEMVEQDPDPFINLIRYSISCERCKELGIPEKCIHKIYEPAPWNAPAALKKIQSLINDPNVFLRETIGLSGYSSSTRCFNNKCVNEVFKTRQVSFEDENPRFIFTCVDPAAGGDGSRFAVVSVCKYGESRICVLSIDIVRNITPDQGYDLLTEHIKALRNIIINERKKFASTPIVLIIECYAHETHHIPTELQRRRVENLILLKEDTGKIGIRTGTTGTIGKEHLVEYTKDKILQKKIALSSKLITNTRHPTGDLFTKSEILKEFQSQLQNFERKVENNSNPDKKPRITFSGKGANRQDDIMMAFMLCIYGKRLFEHDKNDQYSRYKND